MLCSNMEIKGSYRKESTPIGMGMKVHGGILFFLIFLFSIAIFLVDGLRQRELRGAQVCLAGKETPIFYLFPSIRVEIFNEWAQLGDENRG